MGLRNDYQIDPKINTFGFLNLSNYPKTIRLFICEFVSLLVLFVLDCFGMFVCLFICLLGWWVGQPNEEEEE